MPVTAARGGPSAGLEDFLQIFTFIHETPELWAAAGKLSHKLRRKGVTVGLSHCFIAVAAASANVSLATLDSHFDVLCKPAGISLFPLT